MVKVCPGCSTSHTGIGTYCSRGCFNRATKSKRVPWTCQHCGVTTSVRPSDATRKYCSQRCNAAVNRNCTKAQCRKGGLNSARVRFGLWWDRQMARLLASRVTNAEAFKEGYVLGYRRCARKIKRESACAT